MDAIYVNKHKVSVTHRYVILSSLSNAEGMVPLSVFPNTLLSLTYRD